VAAGTPYENELRLRGTDGVYRWFLSRSVPVRDGDGRVVNWFGTSIDIDAMKRLQEDRLAFVDAAAHDLKNPLTALIAHVQLLRRPRRAADP
jgi:signal transduction histidine kinase